MPKRIHKILDKDRSACGMPIRGTELHIQPHFCHDFDRSPCAHPNVLVLGDLTIPVRKRMRRPS